MSIERLVSERRILIVCGSGGVGKTTTAAALALDGARKGRRSAVVTIDPAKRLANALGLDALSDAASEIPRKMWDAGATAPPGGSFSAMMLDTKRTFDRLVEKYASDAKQRQRILDNRFYQNIAGALSGTQEYMAMEKLYELHHEGGYELVVVDTPPSRNALDFLEAPGRLTKFLDARVFRWFLGPARGGMKVVSSAARGFLRTVARTVGVEVLDDAVEFFAAFEGMYDGFRERARKVDQIINDPGTAFVLVSSPRRDAVEEAEFFCDRLSEAKLSVDSLVVNRIHPRFSGFEAAVSRGRAVGLRGSCDVLADLYENLADFDDVADREARNLSGLARKVAPAPITLVPFLERDVADVSGLDEISKYLFA